jgi:hypothetical protein
MSCTVTWYVTPCCGRHHDAFLHRLGIRRVGASGDATSYVSLRGCLRHMRAGASTDRAVTPCHRGSASTRKLASRRPHLTPPPHSRGDAPYHIGGPQAPYRSKFRLFVGQAASRLCLEQRNGKTAAGSAIGSQHDAAKPDQRRD